MHNLLTINATVFHVEKMELSSEESDCTNPKDKS